MTPSIASRLSAVLHPARDIYLNPSATWDAVNFVVAPSSLAFALILSRSAPEAPEIADTSDMAFSKLAPTRIVSSANSFIARIPCFMAEAARLATMPLNTVNPSPAFAAASPTFSVSLPTVFSSPLYCSSCFSVSAAAALKLLYLTRARSVAAEFSPYSWAVFFSSSSASAIWRFCAARTESSCLIFASRPSAEALHASIPAVAALNSEFATWTALEAACISARSEDMSALKVVVELVSAIYVTSLKPVIPGASPDHPVRIIQVPVVDLLLPCLRI